MKENKDGVTDHALPRPRSWGQGRQLLCVEDLGSSQAWFLVLFITEITMSPGLRVILFFARTRGD